MNHLLFVCAIVFLCNVCSCHVITVEEAMFQGKRSLYRDFVKIPHQKTPPILSTSQTQAVMTVTPQIAQPLGDVTVRWKFVENPTSTDALAIWCGDQAFQGDYLDALAINQTKTWSNGFGALVVTQLIPMRCTYSFAYIRAWSGENKPQDVVAHVEVQVAGEPCAPRQGHLSLTLSPSVMDLAYVSGDSCKAGIVQYGTNPQQLDQVMPEVSTTTYTASDMCGSPANETAQMFYRAPGIIHRLQLSSLQPSTQYFYRFGNDADGWSEMFSFRSAPSVHDGESDVRFMLIADMGYWETSFQNTQSMLDSAAQGFDSFALLFGDISYGRSHAWQWDLFFNMLEPLATTVPFMFGIGNHDYCTYDNSPKDPSGYNNSWHPWWGNWKDDSWSECSVPIFHRASAPASGLGIYWYSFDAGMVHVVQMSSEHNFTSGSDQYKWLLSDLSSVDRERTPWIVLCAHRPMYTTQEKEADDHFISLMMRYELEDMLVKYKVNMMATGHLHSYERSCAVYDEQCQPDGTAPVHFVVGVAGAWNEPNGRNRNLGNFSRAYFDGHGHLRVHATREMLTATLINSADNSVADQATIPPWKESTHIDSYRKEKKKMRKQLLLKQYRLEKHRQQQEQQEQQPRWN